MKRTVVVFIVVALLLASSAFAWDLCQEAKDAPYMTNVQMEKFFKDSMQGRTYSGRGSVRDVRSHGGNEFVVVVDCGNDVVANVVSSSSSVKDLSAGTSVEFSGKCNHTFRRAYRDTQRTYQIFELIGGDVR